MSKEKAYNFGSETEAAAATAPLAAAAAAPAKVRFDVSADVASKSAAGSVWLPYCYC